MAIELLARIDEVTGATYFAVNLQGQDYRVSAADVLAYIQEGLQPLEAGFTTQYAAPAATAFSVQITDGSADIHLILTPQGAYADGEIVLPAVANCVDGQEVLVNCTQAVTTFVVDGNGASGVIGEPATLAANAFFRLKFDAPTKNWYRVG